MKKKTKEAMQLCEQMHAARVVTFTDREGEEKPGGMCGCCGSGPEETPSWREEPWFVYRAGICDSDGVYYSMLCEGCLEEIRAQKARRKSTFRDAVASEVTSLMGDDLDGAQSFMEDMEDLGFSLEERNA